MIDTKNSKVKEKKEINVIDRIFFNISIYTNFKIKQQK